MDSELIDFPSSSSKNTTNIQISNNFRGTSPNNANSHTRREDRSPDDFRQLLVSSIVAGVAAGSAVYLDKVEHEFNTLEVGAQGQYDDISA